MLYNNNIIAQYHHTHNVFNVFLYYYIYNDTILSGKLESPSKATTSASAKAERKMNSALFGSSSAQSKDTGSLRLTSLLPDRASSSRSAGTYGSGSSGGEDEILEIFIEEIDAQADAKTMDTMMESLNLKDDGSKDSYRADSKGGPGFGGGADDDDDEDDLLALMDSCK